jgi:hypothetical protein
MAFREVRAAKISMWVLARASADVGTSVEHLPLQQHRTEEEKTQIRSFQTSNCRPPLAMVLGVFGRLFGRQRSTLPPFDFARNRFHMRKKWPPNLRELTEKQQFRFERKFKRRIKMKAVRPQWNARVKIVQWSIISFILVYGVLFHDFAKDPMNPRPGEQPFLRLRGWMWDKLGSFYTHTEATMEERGRGARRVEPLGNSHLSTVEDSEGEGRSFNGK